MNRGEIHRMPDESLQLVNEANQTVQVVDELSEIRLEDNLSPIGPAPHESVAVATVKRIGHADYSFFNVSVRKNGEAKPSFHTREPRTEDQVIEALISSEAL